MRLVGGMLALIYRHPWKELDLECLHLRISCRARNIFLWLVAAMSLGMHSPVPASDEVVSKLDRELAKQCIALAERDMSRLRQLLDGKLLHPLTTNCPGYPPLRLADLATENLTHTQWLQFRELAAPEERERLTDLRLRFLLRMLARMDQAKPALDRIDQLMDQGALPRDENGKVNWGSVADLLDVLHLSRPEAATDEDKARATRIFLDRMLSRLPAERDADLTPLLKGIVYLPEPKLLEAVHLLKARFGSFNPDRETGSDASYPLQGAAPFFFYHDQPPLSDAAVLAIVDLRLPAPPTLPTWIGVIDQDRQGVLDTFIQRGYPLPREKDYNGWSSILVSGVSAIEARGSARSLDKMLAVAKRDDLPPEIADRLVLMLAFIQPKAPQSQLPLTKRWELLDRLVVLGADPNRAFANKAEVRNRFDMYALIRRSPAVATGLLDHGLSTTSPVLPSGGNILTNYLMTVRPVPEPEPELDVIRDILKRKNIINTFDPGVRHFPIEFAVMNHSPEFAKAFYALGVDIHVRDPNGYGLVTRASANGYAKLVKFLLEAGADANETTPDGISPLAYAQCAKTPEVSELLRQHGGLIKGAPDCGSGRQ